MTINDKTSTCELVSFSHFRINVTKMQVHDNADFSITGTDFGSFYHPERVVKEIPYFRNHLLG